MKLKLFTLLILLSVAFAASAADLTGEWHGTLHTGRADLHLVLHVVKADKGALQATLDSVDQHAYAIPVASVTVDGSSVTLDVAAVHGSYRGTFENQNTIRGTWKQNAELPLVWDRDTTKAASHTQNSASPKPTGTWLGTLDTGAIKLRVAFHIESSPSGLTATMDSLDQNAKGIPVSKVTLEGGTIAMDVPAVRGRFEGKIDGNRIEGTWSQGGASLPLVMERVKEGASLDRKRPQDPVPPLPYRTEEVTFANDVAKIRLAGTLTTPEGRGPFRTAVLITGSGPQDRDEAIMGHRPFLVLADSLTRRGIAVLRFDDRGVGKSGGNFATATTADFATDVEAAVSFLRTRKEIGEIGLIGHSEGGLIAPMVAAKDEKIGFVVLLAGPALPGADLLVEQVRALALGSGKTADEAAKTADEERAILKTVIDAPDEKSVRDALSKAGMAPPAADAEAKQLTSPWFRFFAGYDPVPVLRGMKCPVLALDGAKDLQVPPELNVPALRRALAANENATVIEVDGVNHLFQTAKSGMPSEYAEIDETIAPKVLATIGEWIAKH